MFCEDRVGQQGFKAGISVVIWGGGGVYMQSPKYICNSNTGNTLMHIKGYSHKVAKLQGNVTYREMVLLTICWKLGLVLRVQNYSYVTILAVSTCFKGNKKIEEQIKYKSWDFIQY